MTSVNINTSSLRTNVDKSLSEVKTNLKTISNSAKSISTSLTFTGSGKIADILSKIDGCITKINNTLEWYKDCSYNYEHFSSDAVGEVDSLEVSELKTKEFKI